jgi:hypothetical protein
MIRNSAEGSSLNAPTASWLSHVDDRIRQIAAAASGAVSAGHARATRQGDSCVVTVTHAH